ncbi:MAG: hypothetical protein DMF84_29445 [Acidobacteria bacterium]|nr:MAG: hypothetical protein DMF84_29445 [Acidobacteriota bacterium]
MLPCVLRHPIPRAFLMIIPLVICVSRVHGHGVATPGALTQEVNRCLTMVRIAATRRSPTKAVTLYTAHVGYSWEPRRLTRAA